jgi:hypothetical protein
LFRPHLCFLWQLLSQLYANPVDAGLYRSVDFRQTSHRIGAQRSLGNRVDTGHENRVHDIREKGKWGEDEILEKQDELAKTAYEEVWNF